jgi:3-hydroxyisobutyrate dehydrogenase-like beta-hydroxyacid dehydrogenase
MLALDAARASGVSFPTGSALRGVFESALGAGQSELDWASIAEVTRRRVRADDAQPFGAEGATP